MAPRFSTRRRLALVPILALSLLLFAGCSDVAIPELPPARADLPPAEDFSSLRGTAIDLLFDGRGRWGRDRASSR